MIQTGESNLIEYNYAEETFAVGVGLIRRSFAHLTTQTICPECPWSEKAECGYTVDMELVAFE